MTDQRIRSGKQRNANPQSQARTCGFADLRIRILGYSGAFCALCSANAPHGSSIVPTIHDGFTLSGYYGVAFPTFAPDHAAEHPHGAHEKPPYSLEIRTLPASVYPHIRSSESAESAHAGKHAPNVRTCGSATEKTAETAELTSGFRGRRISGIFLGLQHLDGPQSHQPVSPGDCARNHSLLTRVRWRPHTRPSNHAYSWGNCHSEQAMIRPHNLCMRPHIAPKTTYRCPPLLQVVIWLLKSQ